MRLSAGGAPVAVKRRALSRSTKLKNSLYNIFQRHNTKLFSQSVFMVFIRFSEKTKFIFLKRMFSRSHVVSEYCIVAKRKILSIDIWGQM
jgi:hypothetical protein